MIYLDVCTYIYAFTHIQIGTLNSRSNIEHAVALNFDKVRRETRRCES